MKNTEELIDNDGRMINYLRISLTDLCNFRCVYCTPVEGLPVMPTSFYLTPDEVRRFVEISCQMGITRVRLTGGEPLLRQDLVEIVSMIKSIKGVEDLSITTNGSRLKTKLKSLKEAGLDRINISLDSMNAERFREVTLKDCYGEVMSAVHEALRIGFPVKLNMVILKGLSQAEIIEYVSLAEKYPLEVRFLEFMPLCGTGWKQEFVLPIQTVRAIVMENFSLIKLHRGDNVAESFKLEKGLGKVGFIASLSESFCDQCSRIRLSADGNIQPCLFSEEKVSVKQLLRDKASDEAIKEAIREAVKRKPRGNWFRDHPFKENEYVDGAVSAGPMIRFIGG